MPSASSVLVHNAAHSPLGSISLVGHLRDSAGLPERPLRVLGSYGVVYVLAGGGRFADASGFSAEVCAGDLLLLFPDVPHTYGPSRGLHWSELYVVFDGPVFDLWRRTGLLDPARPVRHLEPIDRWAREFDRVLGPARRQERASVLVDVCRWQTALAQALSAAGAGTAGSQDEQRWVTRAGALLAADVRREASLADIAAELGMSYDGFRKRFRKLAGSSPARYRSVCSIDRASEMMAQGGLSDREIASALGYCDQFNFSHRFKEITGRTPRKFRATIPR